MAGLCFLVAIAMALGQVLLKVAAEDITGRVSGGFLSVASSPWLGLALIVYGFATILWIWILMHVPLSKAYPFALLAIALVPLAGIVFFGESVSRQYIAGFGFVLIGLALIQNS